MRVVFESRKKLRHAHTPACRCISRHVRARRGRGPGVQHVLKMGATPGGGSWRVETGGYEVGEWVKMDRHGQWMRHASHKAYMICRGARWWWKIGGQAS